MYNKSEEIQKSVEKMERFRKNLTKEKAREFLVEAGICDKDGKLTEPYK